MKKYTLFAFIFVFALGLFFNSNITNAYDSGCSSAGPFSSTTGHPCGNTTSPSECAPGDLFSYVTGYSCTGSGTTGTTIGTYDTFAQCLTNKSVTLYGAFWSPGTISQKTSFGSSAKFLNYVECSTADGSGRMQACVDKNITAYPTWEFSDFSRLIGNNVTLQQLADKTSCVLPVSTDIVYFDPIKSSIFINQPYNITWHGKIKGTDVSNQVIELQIKDLTTGTLLAAPQIKNTTNFSFIPTTTTTSAQAFIYGYDENGNWNGVELAKSNEFSIVSGTTTTSNSSISVLSPNGMGELTWARGSTQTIGWQDTSGVNVNYDIKLVTIGGGYAGCSMSSTGCAPVYNIAKSVQGFLYNWSVGRIWETMSSMVPDGSYTVQVCQAGTTNCGSSKYPVDIGSGTTTSSTPVISGVSGPQTLNVNQQGTWTVKASDKSGGNLTYSVNWGDFNSTDILQGNSLIQPQSQAATFTHIYPQAGVYKLTFTVRNSSDQSAQTSLSVNVGNTTASCALTAQVTNTYLGNNNDWGFYVKVNTVNQPNTSNGWTTNFQGYVPSITSYGVEKLYGNFFLSYGPLSFTARDSIDSSCTTTITVSPPTATSSLTITTPSPLPNATVGQPYSVALNVSGGTDSSAYSWSVGNGESGFPVTGLGFPSYGNPVYMTGTPAKVYVGGIEQIVPYPFTFNVTVKNGSASTTKTFTLTVNPAVTSVPAPVVQILANPSNITYGGSSILTWSTVNAGYCYATGGVNGWSGSRPTAGNFNTGALKGSTAFSLICYNNNGVSSSSSVTVNVATQATPVYSVTVLSPNGGETYQAGQTTQMPIRWRASCGLSSFNIYLYKSSSQNMTYVTSMVPGICQSGQSTTDYYTTWPIPSTLPAGNDYKLRIYSISPNGQNAFEDYSDAFFSITAAAVQAPSLHLTSSVNGVSYDSSSVSMKVGDTIKFSGTPQNLKGPNYSTDYTRAWFFDEVFNYGCSNNEASYNSEWSLTCTPQNAGTSRVYVEIYQNGQTYRSNIINVNVENATTTPPPVSNGPVITSISPSSGPIGTRVTIYGSGFGSGGYVAFGGLIPYSGTNDSSTSLSFNVPSNVSGLHNIYLLTSSGQSSNVVQFNVTSQ